MEVWFDEVVLELGDSLRQKIDEGLSKCRYGVVILSPSFFQKEWARRELDGLIARETASGKKAILPIWHNIDLNGVAVHSPTLADRLAAQTTEGIETIVARVLEVFKKEVSVPANLGAVPGSAQALQALSIPLLLSNQRMASITLPADCTVEDVEMIQLGAREVLRLLKSEKLPKTKHEHLLGPVKRSRTELANPSAPPDGRRRR